MQRNWLFGMDRTRRLAPDEVPVEIRSLFDFDSQVKDPNGRHLEITKQCPTCGHCKAFRVANMRQQIKKGYTFKLCRKCQSVGERCATWKGGKTHTTNGYVGIRIPRAEVGKRYEMEHRLVMEKSIGRKLLPHETVHHKNGIKDDNRIENLELWSSNHGSGVRSIDQLVDQIDWLFSQPLQVVT